MNNQTEDNITIMGSTVVDNISTMVDNISTILDNPTDIETSFTIKKNPVVVPPKFDRYRHPSHHHRLFMIISQGHNSCNNKNCSVNISYSKTMFRCFRCDYDLCGKCFQIGTASDPVPLADDDQYVNENTIDPIDISSFCVVPEN